MKISPAIVGIVAASLAACSAAPGSIAPASMPGAYDGLTCRQAHDTRGAETERLQGLIIRQESTRTAEGVNLFLFGIFGAVANAALDGDVSDEIAVGKGRVEALDARLARCV